MMLALVALAAIVALAVTRTRKAETLAAEHIDHTDTSGGTVRQLEPARADFAYPLVLSPNRSARGGAKVTTLVWHYTAGQSATAAVAWLCRPEAKASAHFVIGRDGKVTQLVSLSDAAWHVGNAGVSNASSIGIELVGLGWVTRGADGEWYDAGGKKVVPDRSPVQATLRWEDGTTVQRWWVPYTEAQYAAAIALVAVLGQSPYAACLADQCGHQDIARPTGRKTDPGPLFAWDRISTFDQRKRLARTSALNVPGGVV